ncbi:Arylsulfatase A (ASA) (Cerebroside-sulfatase) [Cleaved into: Arylsulfatase A component B [Durusdinium trenchii]|uniref:Arylsulfatase A (ASA) (Cerebroside-sulfatase) [Cleaved into: Arylsulfatase A component B n=1 Tax=Durusdinium trenchii TaxID=1381693 RepID=A0ABP0LEG8_9DINO
MQSNRSTRFLSTSHFLVSAVLLGYVSSSAATALGESRPNIVYILADDLGYGDLGSYGQEKIQTPNLDQLAAEGMRFTQAYSGSSVCAPSRCTLMTGLHTGNCRNPDTGEDPLLPEDVTVAELLQTAGYKTGMFGKWGLGPAGTTGTPDLQGFDQYYGYLDQAEAHNHYPQRLWKNGSEVALNGQKYAPDEFTQGVLDFVDESQDEPFFLYWPTTLPHAGMQVPASEPSFADYRAEFGDEPAFAGAGNYVANPYPRATRAAMITRMDRDVGALVQKLKDTGQYENTLIIFASDNGPSTEGGPTGSDNFVDFFNARGEVNGVGLRGEAPLEAKHNLLEGGIRTPMIASWPGQIAAGTTSDRQVAMWDFLPTATEMAGVQTPSGLDGVSFLPTLLGQAQVEREYLYWEWPLYGDAKAVRVGDWKLIKYDGDPPYPNDPIELYNLASDVGETTNLYSTHPDKVAELMDYIDGVPPIPDPDPDPDPDVDPRGAILFYDFESAPGGVVSDNSGVAAVKDLTLFGGAAIVTDSQRGNVLSLDGIDDYAATAANAVGDKLDTQDSLTMMAWIKTEDSSRSVIATRTNGPGYLFEINRPGEAGLLTAHVGGPGVDATATSTVNDGEWHHVAMTYDGETLRGYVDGIEEAMLEGSPTDSTQDYPFMVGALRPAGESDARLFSGMIDDLRVYNIVLTADQIQELMSPSSGMPGDFNDDGIVNLADYVVWRNNLGGNDAVLHGNGTGGGTVVAADYELWKSHFGNGSSNDGGPGGTLPGSNSAGFYNGWRHHRRMWGWSAQILPFMELTSEYDLLAPGDRTVREAMLEPTAAPIFGKHQPNFLCPSGIANDATNNAEMYGSDIETQVQMAIMSYVSCAGPYNSVSGHKYSGDKGGAIVFRDARIDSEGIKRSTKNITDGTSNTIIVSERSENPDEPWPRGRGTLYAPSGNIHNVLMCTVNGIWGSRGYSSDGEAAMNEGAKWTVAARSLHPGFTFPLGVLRRVNHGVVVTRFITVLAECERELASFVLALVPNFADADEILQETKLRLWEQFEDYDPELQFSKWAKTIARYQVLTYRKTKGREKVYFSTELMETVAEDFEYHANSHVDRSEALQFCLNSLSSRCQSLLRECYAGKPSVARAAKTVGMAVQSARKAIYRRYAEQASPEFAEMKTWARPGVYAEVFGPKDNDLADDELNDQIENRSVDQKASADGVARPGIEPREVAHLEAEHFVARVLSVSSDASWSEGGAPKDFLLRLRPNEHLAIESGFVEIEFHSSARVVLHGPARFVPLGSQSARLEQGKLTGEAENGGFQLETGAAEVIDIGTAFGVAVDDVSGTDVYVFDGEVEVTPMLADKQPPQSHLLTEGIGVRVRMNGDVDYEASIDVDSFTRSVPKSNIVDQQLDRLTLIDIVSGGDGFGNLLAGAINPLTGDWDHRSQLYKNGKHKGLQPGDGIYHHCSCNDLVDGVFVPKGSAGEIQVDSKHNSFRLEESEGVTYGPLWVRRKTSSDDFLRDSDRISANFWGTGTLAPILSRLADSRTGLMGIHPNVGITFNLSKIRHNQERSLSRFQATVANLDNAEQWIRHQATLAPRENVENWVQSELAKYTDRTADVRVLIDGKPRYSRLDFSRRDGDAFIDVEITEEDEFLTILSTDAANATSFDHVVLIDPEFILTVVQE